MTLARRTFYLSSALLLAGAMGVAQAAMGGSSQDQDSSMAGQAAGAKLRGCLSGSNGNYTLTDHSGTIYHLVGGEAQLQGAVGHEVEITGTPSAQRSGVSDDMAGNTASSFEVTGAREVGARCDHGASTGTVDNNSQPMTERPPSTDHQPKGAPGEGTPPEPHPQTLAMLQQPGSTDTGNAGSPSSTMNSPASPSTSRSRDAQSVGTSNSATPGTPPPVTSQTPAAPQSPTNPNSQLGAGTASQTGTSTAAGTSAAGATGAEGANAATSTNNANRGMNANSGANANPSTTTSPQSAQNDQSKPLYERQATDVPWASHSGSTTTTTTTNPNGSSTTTTTTTPQAEPHL